MARHLPSPVANGTATRMGAAQARQRLRLAIHLPLRYQAELADLLHDLYDPASPQFHQYLTTSEFTDRFGPTVEDSNAVVAWATANGLTVTARPANRRLVAVEGSVDAVNRAFHVNVNYYKHPTDSRMFYSPDREPATVGLNVPLLQVTGMNDYVLPRPLMQHRTPANATGSGPSGGFLPRDLRAAYDWQHRDLESNGRRQQRQGGSARRGLGIRRMPPATMAARSTTRPIPSPGSIRTLPWWAARR